MTLRWESAAGSAYRVQGSADGQTWTDLVRFPAADLASDGGWLSVDGRAGLVVRGTANPLSVYGDVVVLSDGPAEQLVVEGLPFGDPAAVKAAADRAAPRAGHPAVRASSAGGHLSLFNLSPDPVTTVVAVPQQRTPVSLFAGTQTVTAGGTDVLAELDGASAKVVATRFTLRSATGGPVPTGIRAEVVDAATVRLTGPNCRVVVTTPGGSSATVALRSGRTTAVLVRDTVPHPLDDAALGCDTFPNGPLPTGMSDPAAAVDGDPGTAWTPGSARARMVVDLGSPTAVQHVSAAWTSGRIPSAALEFSTDGVTYSAAGALRRHGRTTALDVQATARYVALAVSGWAAGDALLTGLSVVPG